LVKASGVIESRLDERRLRTRRVESDLGSEDLSNSERGVSERSRWAKWGLEKPCELSEKSMYVNREDRLCHKAKTNGKGKCGNQTIREYKREEERWKVVLVTIEQYIE